MIAASPAALSGGILMKFRSKFLLVLGAAVAAPAAAQSSAPDDDRNVIIVTGTRLEDSEKALQACIARNCPPDEDIDATLAHVENQFVAGDYRDARTTLLASLKRNGDEAKDYPEPVSDLNRANARVAAHLGFENDYYSSTWGILRALKKGIPEQDYRHFGARLEIAAMTASVKGPAAAKIVYAKLAGDAREAGRGDIAALAELRSIWLDYLVFPAGDAKRKLAALAQSPDPAARASAMAARVLLARIGRNEGREDATDALIKEMAALNLKTPTLLYSPRWELAQQAREADTGSDLTRMATGTFDDKWIDVGYWVQPDGRVADVEILRKSGETGWARPLLASIEGRIYSPTQPEDGGAYRIERYTYTSRFENRTGTRLLQRSARARVEYLDLTADPPSASN